MTFLQSIILGIVQGLTEFLPVSSSGHLILAEKLLGLNDAAALKGFDIALHIGTLLALLVYFRKDLMELILAGFRWLGAGFKTNKLTEEDGKQVLMIKILVVGTIPAIIAGLLFNDLIDEYLVNPLTVTIMLVLVSGIFFLAESFHRKMKPHNEVSWKEGMLIGISQCLALIPGVSRSGSTISSGIFLGIERSKAARFSFLLGSVATFAAVVYAAFEVYKGKYVLPPLDVLLAGIGTSFVTGWMAISFLLNYLKKHSLAVFAWYRLVVVVVFWIAIYATGAVLMTK